MDRLNQAAAPVEFLSHTKAALEPLSIAEARRTVFR